MRNHNTDTLLELNEVAERLKISRKALELRIRRGDLEVIDLGRRCRRVRLSALEAYLEKNTVVAPTAGGSAP